MEKKVTLLIRGVPESLRRDLKVLAATEGISLQALINRLLREYVERMLK